MREIKFRAKKITDDSWIYWDILNTPANLSSIIDVDTVCAYLGKEDTLGNSIYEGDIMEGKFVRFNVYEQFYIPLRQDGDSASGIVYFRGSDKRKDNVMINQITNKPFTIKVSFGVWSMPKHYDDIKIIGNIFDNIKQ